MNIQRPQTSKELSVRKDPEWADMPMSNVSLAAPFTFKDTTDYRRTPLVLATADDVFDFFCDRYDLFWPLEWDSHYECRLKDAHHIDCWVEKNRSGNMRLLVLGDTEQGILPGVAQG